MSLRLKSLSVLFSIIDIFPLFPMHGDLDTNAKHFFSLFFVILDLLMAFRRGAVFCKPLYMKTRAF